MSRRIDHVGVRRLIEVYESEQYIHVVYEYLKGKDLIARIQLKKTYTEDDVAYLAKSLLNTISYLHEKSIIVRNLSPENLFLAYVFLFLEETTPKIRDCGKKQILKIMDFTLAIKMNGNQLETMCCGFPGYIAPEVLRKEGYSQKADVFSCGVVLYYLYPIFIPEKNRLTGVTPFMGDSTEEVIEKNKQSDIEFPEDLWKQVSPEAKDLVVRMTESDQYERISARECLAHEWFASKPGRCLNRLSSALSKIKKTNTGISKVHHFLFFWQQKSPKIKVGNDKSKGA